MALVLALVFFLATVGIGAPPSGAAGSDVDLYIELINGLRAGQGRAPLTVLPELSEDAQVWADSMAASGVLGHDPNPTAGLSVPWTRFGENVGQGVDTASVMQAFVASPAHLGNIMGIDYTHVGVGVARDGAGRQWVAQRFLRLEAPKPPPEVAFVPPPAPPAPPPSVNYAVTPLPPPPTAAAPRTATVTGGAAVTAPAPVAEVMAEPVRASLSNREIRQVLFVFHMVSVVSADLGTDLVP